MSCKHFITECGRVEGAGLWLQVIFAIYFFSCLLSSILRPEKGLVLKNAKSAKRTYKFLRIVSLLAFCSFSL